MRLGVWQLRHCELLTLRADKRDLQLVVNSHYPARCEENASFHGYDVCFDLGLSRCRRMGRAEDAMIVHTRAKRTLDGSAMPQIAAERFKNKVLGLE